jgi:hypothetical protein
VRAAPGAVSAAPGARAAAVAAALLALALVGCTRNAPSPDEVRPVRVPAAAYADYDCAQLDAEHRRLAPREAELRAQLQARADWDDAMDRLDTVAVFVGRRLPTGELKQGDSPLSDTYARVRGELDAVEKERIRKRCAL